MALSQRMEFSIYGKQISIFILFICIWGCFFPVSTLKTYSAAIIRNNFNLWEQFCCSCIYIKTVRNKSQLFKETTWVVKLLHCWSACRWYTDLIFSALPAYTSALLIHFLGNFPSVRLVDQQRKQMEVTFYSRCCIMGSEVGILARKIRLAMTVVMKSWTTHYRLDPTGWASNFHCMD